MLFRVLLEALHFFDRHWKKIVIAAILSVGLVLALSLVIKVTIPIPKSRVPIPGRAPFIIDYHSVIEAVLFFGAYVWFQTFIAAVAKCELFRMDTSYGCAALTSTVMYPRVLLATIAASVVANISLFAVLPLAAPLGEFATLLLIPLICFTVWFSMIPPVIVIDEFRSVLRALVRSRLLVSGYFFVVLMTLFLGSIPAFATFGITDTTAYWPVFLFIMVSTVILSTVLMISAYLNIRIAKGELAIVQPGAPDEKLHDEEAHET